MTFSHCAAFVVPKALKSTCYEASALDSMGPWHRLSIPGPASPGLLHWASVARAASSVDPVTLNPKLVLNPQTSRNIPRLFRSRAGPRATGHAMQDHAADFVSKLPGSSLALLAASASVTLRLRKARRLEWLEPLSLSTLSPAGPARGGGVLRVPCHSAGPRCDQMLHRSALLRSAALLSETPCRRAVICQAAQILYLVVLLWRGSYSVFFRDALPLLDCAEPAPG